MRNSDKRLIVAFLVLALNPRVGAQSPATLAWKGAQKSDARAEQKPQADLASDANANADAAQTAGAAPAFKSAVEARYAALHEQDLLVINSVASTAGDFRSVIDKYWSFVRRYPTSGYSDNALWQAANLSAESFRRFSEERDKARAVQLLQWLRDQYPHSSLRAFALSRLATFEDTPEAVSADAETDSTAPASPTASEAEPSSAAPSAAGPLSVAAPSSAASTAATIRAVQREVLPEVVRVTVELDREVSFSQERIDGPARLFFDIKASRTVPSLVDATFRYNSDVVRHIRFGRHPNRTTRIVLDFENVSTYSVFTLYNPYRIVIDAERTDRARVERPLPAPAPASAAAPPPSPPPAPLAARQFVTNSTRRAPAVFPTRVTVITRPTPVPTPQPIPVTRTVPVPPRLPVTRSRTYAVTAVVAPVARESADLPSSVVEQRVENVPTDKAVMAGKPIAPSANSSGKFSVARQLGLGVSRIVIDAGHGGHDPGATAHGVSEAELVLDIALRLDRLLSDQGMDVVLTRRKNEYLSLDQRTEIANRESADLFLSIHANASANAAARGVETYFLNFALNPQAEAVAARENAASGMTMNSLPNIVKAITLNNKLNESRDFAASIQRALVKGMRPGNKALRDLGVKQAPFVVLIGASMPSVLAEVSFVTNRQEARLLTTPAYRQRIAESLLAGILRYQDSLKKVQTAARQ